MLSLVNPADSVERQNEKLMIIAQSLMRRVEQKTDQTGLAYQQFERAALLETQVRERTDALERALELLQESNARLEIANAETEQARNNLTGAIETINEGFALFDRDEKLVLYNSRFCRDLMDITGALHEGLHFTDYVALIANSKFLALPESVTAEDWTRRRLKHHSSNHVVFNVRLMWNRWIQVSEHRTADGGTVILQTDVTEIMRGEQQERDKMRNRQAQMLQATLDHLNQGVCIFDAAQALVGWNSYMDRMVTLPSHKSVKGLTFSTLLDLLGHELRFKAEFDAERLARWADRGAGRSPIAFEVTHRDARIYSVFAQEMPDQGFVFSFTDVTGQREAAHALEKINERLEQGVRERTEELGVALEEAKRANASKSRFVAAASHDLLQPLSAAKLFMSSLKDRIDTADTLAVVDKAETALQGVENIIEALLDISKLDAGKATFTSQPVRLSAILDPLADQLGPLARAKGLDLRVIGSGLSVVSDPSYLRRIIQNLMSNAIRYTDTGRVVVGVRRNGASARIEVWDTGPGIAVADQTAIFQEFHRLSGSTAADGLGLGLAIVERACKGLGHQMDLWSEPGQGSCFSLNVPIDAGSASDVPVVVAADATDGDALDGMIVLLVENDLRLSTALTMMIETHGAEVLPAHSAAEAQALMREIDLVPDVLLLDYQLGNGSTGLDLYRAVQESHGDVPCAIISADRTKALKQGCKALGLPLIPKPVDTTKLINFLHMHADGSTNRR